MVAAIVAAFLISGTVPEKPVVVNGNKITITQTATLKAKVVGNKIIVRSTL